jgi:serine/threonine protein kinase
MSPKTFKHFQILELLGRGGMGEVYLAQDNTLERKVALKFLPRDLLRDPSAQGRLLDEARSISRVQHPNIATVHSIEEDGGIFALCMEYIEGATLKQMLSRGTIPMKQLVKIGADMAAALQAAHEQGVIHRDIKPANVMVTNRGEVKVMDFGLALRPERVVHTLGPNTYGTVQYMSPEQARGEKLTPRSDIFSFGSTLYELAAGRAPFNAANDLAILHAIISDEPTALREHRRDVPPAFEQLVRRCMLKQIDLRWSSMSEILEELNYILPTVESGPRDLISELSVGLSEQRRRPQHRPANAGAIGQRRNANSMSNSGELPWNQGSASPAPGVPAISAGRPAPESPRAGGRTGEFSVRRRSRSSPALGAIGNEIALKDPPSAPRPQPRLKAVRGTQTAHGSRAMAGSGSAKSRGRSAVSSGPRTNVFENLGDQLARSASRPQVHRPKRESPWSVILPLAFAILLAAAAGYGLLVRAGLNEIRGNGGERDRGNDPPVQDFRPASSTAKTEDASGELWRLSAPDAADSTRP